MTSKIPRFSNLQDLCDYLKDLIIRRVRYNPSEKPPSSYEDPQDQIRAVMRFMELCESHKKNGDFWTALAYLHPVLGYYVYSHDLGKCGHILLEIADCFFSCNEVSASTACCCEAVNVLIRSRDEHDWTREVAAIGELLLVSVQLNKNDDKQAVEAMRALRRTLPQKDRRILSGQDAHKVSRKLIVAHKMGTDGPLIELELMPPRRKRTEDKNLRSLLSEWAGHYNAVRSAVEQISSKRLESAS